MTDTANDETVRSAPEPSQRFATDGVQLAWDRWGDGPGGDLVLVHGFTGSAHDFSLVVPTLATEGRVVAFDHRGHARSTNLGRLDGYSFDQLVTDLLALLDAHAEAPVHLLGHSMGGRVVLGAVLARPDLVRSLVLMDTTAFSFLPPDEATAAAISGFVDRFDPGRGLPDPNAMRGPEDDLIETATPEAWRARKDELYAAMDPFAFKALGLQLFDAASSVGDRLGEIVCPTTVIVGEHDHPFVDAAPSIVEALPHGRLACIDGAYHSPQLTHADAWLVAMRAHLAWAEAA